MSTKSSQIYIFFGDDDFSLKRKLDRWKEEFIKKYSKDGVQVIERESLSEDDIIKKLQEVSAPSLFSQKKLILIKDCLPTKAAEEKLGEYILSLTETQNPETFYVFHSAKKPDKRLGVIKKILNANVNVTEFNLPHGSTLNAWLKAYAKQMGFQLEDAAAEKLAVYLGRDYFEEKRFGGRVTERKEAFDLWQAYSELQKLSNYSDEIRVQDVEQLVTPKVSENIFNMVQKVFAGDKKSALTITENLFADQTMDEKGTAIKMVGLLSEQIRAVLLVSLLKNKNLDNQEIADTLGWSSGRVFMVLKQTAKVNIEKLKNMLEYLLRIDNTLKTSETNPKLLIEKFFLKFA